GELTAKVQLPPALERTDEYFGEVRVYYNEADITLIPDRATPLAQLSVTSQGCADAGLCYPPRKQVFTLNFAEGTAVESTANPRPAATTSPPAAAASIGTLLYMLLLAFGGGAILNLMPCVFPILSLKVLGFARSNDHDRHVHGWLYAAGVVASFLFVAGVLIALQQAGNAIGWGFQLQTPGFVIALAYLFVAMGLSLSGVVEFGGSVMNVGSGLADKQGKSGSFFTGVLAVVVASPCTAPFMGTALGFAVTQPAIIALAVFAALGAGMAAPLLLLSYSQLARKLMPKPGRWMDSLKQFLAFPLYATAIWLLWVAGRQTGIDTMAVAMAGALVLAMGLWAWGHSHWHKVITVICVALAVSLGSWRGPGNGENSDSLAPGTVAWSPAALQELRSQGKPVFVDVTADWCITCIANEQAVLFTDEMTAAFAEHGVTYMVADWTNYDPEIADFIAQHGRNGIPLYLMYPGDLADSPVILPQILTSATVEEALQAVSVKKGAIAGTL
ncbi:MAG: thioredoxin family protein, partial [Halieaceae bacterium]